LNAIVSGFTYQPFSSGARAGCATTVGGVASKRNVADASVWFPATSEHWPEALAASESGPEYVVAPVHDAIPDVASLPAKVTPTGFAYQPFASGPRASAALAVGAVASYSSATDADVLVLPAPSRQTRFRRSRPIP
jgi:hypothetical protein